mmetsp:Transcript_42729/g.65610  ORF Transcript_42729/g.65610 Transcript_42729/m.65610 type:complete len:433 (+) Transcript_42729:720-2018(+)
MSQMNRLKRAAFERKVTQKFREMKEKEGFTGERDEVKLDMLRDQDPFYSKVYQEVYAELKETGSNHTSHLEQLHERFDDYKNDFKNMGMAKTHLYELNDLEWENDVEITTDFSDENDLLFYRRYKMWTKVRKDKAKEFNEEQALIQKSLGRYEDSELEGEEVAYDTDGEPIIHDKETKLINLRERKADFNKIDAGLEIEMNRIRQKKMMKKRDYMLWQTDHVFGNYHPQHLQSKDLREDSSFVHPELKRVLTSNMHENPKHLPFSVTDKTSEHHYEDYRDLALNYYKSKAAFLHDCYFNALEFVPIEAIKDIAVTEETDRLRKERIDHMFNYADFDADRTRARTKFLHEMNKRSSLADIGEHLDKLVIDEKARNLEHYDLSQRDEVPYYAKQDLSADDFKWSGKLNKIMDPKTPLFLEDQDQIKEAQPGFYY